MRWTRRLIRLCVPIDWYLTGYISCEMKNDAPIQPPKPLLDLLRSCKFFPNQTGTRMCPSVVGCDIATLSRMCPWNPKTPAWDLRRSNLPWERLQWRHSRLIFANMMYSPCGNYRCMLEIGNSTQYTRFSHWNADTSNALGVEFVIHAVNFKCCVNPILWR